MKQAGMCLLALIMLYTPITALADGHDELVHASAHLGVSYVLTDVFYGVFHKGFGMDKTRAYIFGAFYTLVGGLTYEYMQGASQQHTWNAMKYNALGVALKGIAIKIDF